MPARQSKWEAQHRGCQAAVDNVKADLKAEIERLDGENQRYREALELISRGVWTAPNSIETIIFTARRALQPLA